MTRSTAQHRQARAIGGDTELLPKAHRARVSRTAGWIAPIVVVNGRIAGTWELEGEEVVVSMFDGAPLPKKLDAATDRVARAAGLGSVRVRAA
ncbi:hypothetical protein [Nocardia carnea]|uniref:hypothetical protein n=1 Tax=Nocardia carnea TaxID=37328 RepID=UPI0024539C7B|nr:hypothetical protein [Nocardia carnea]